MEKKRLRFMLGFSMLSLVVGCRGVQHMSGRRGPHDEQAEALVAQLQSGDPIAALDAETRLKEMGADALPALVKFVTGDQAKGQRQAIRIIGQVGGKPAADALVKVLLDVGLHLKSDVMAQLSKCGKDAVDPLVKAVPTADDISLLDLQTVLMLLGDKSAIDQIIHRLHKHLKSKDKDTPKVMQLRVNTVSVMRALTGRSCAFDKDAPEEDQRKALLRWISWWRQDRGEFQLK